MVLPFENMDYGVDEVGARTIPELTDVELTDLANGEVLMYNSSSEKWENQVIIDIDTLSNLTDTDITAPITNGSILTYDSTTGKWKNGILVDIDTLSNLSDTNISSIANKDFLLYDSTSSKWINLPSNIDNLNNVNITTIADKELLKYNNSSGKWENNNLLINELQDVNITSLSNGEVLKYNSSTGKWENQDNTDTLNELTDVDILFLTNNFVLKYDFNSGKWNGNYVNLTELGDTNITTLNQGDILRYNSITQKWTPSPFNIEELDNVNITSVANNEILKYNSSTGKWENSNRIDSLNELGDVTITNVSTNDLLRYNGSIWENKKIALDNDFTNINFGTLANGDLIKYDGSNFSNFIPTYLDGAGILNNNLIKVVGGATTATSLFETSVSGVSTSLQIYIPAGINVLAGTIETELFNTNKTRINITTGGIATTKGITVTEDGRVGIGIIEPEEDFEVDGSIQIDSANVARLKFQQSGNPATAHALGEIDGEQDGTNGGDLQFYTKVDGGSVTEKLRINNIGAIGVGGANYGTTGQVLISRGANLPAQWSNQAVVTYTQGTGVSISPTNVISIGQPVGTTDNVIFQNLDATGSTILRNLTLIYNTIFSENTNQIEPGTTYNIYPSINGSKNLFLGYNDTAFQKFFWKTVSTLAKEKIDLICYNEQFGVPYSSTLIRMLNTGTPANNVINYVAEGDHNFYEDDYGKNGTLNTAVVNLKDSSTDANVYSQLKTTNVGDLQLYTRDGASLTEKIRINSKGAVGVGGSNFGSSGQVLTSNGSGSSVSWTTPSYTPYFFKAELGSNVVTVSAGQDIDVNTWVASLPSPYDGNNADLINTVVWRCPADGLYAVNARLNMYNGNDFLRGAAIKLWKQSSGSSTYVSVAEGLHIVSLADTADDIVTINPSFYDLIPMVNGEFLKIGFSYLSNGGALTIFVSPSSVWTIQRAS